MNECTNKSKRKKKTMNIEKFEEFISQYPIFEYRILDTKDITIQERVRTICQEECERYDSTWACPPAVGTLEECEKKIKSFPQAVFFSSVAEVSDIMNMEEMLSTRHAHESHGVVVNEIVERESMEYNLGGNTILWFSMVLFR